MTTEQQQDLINKKETELEEAQDLVEQIENDIEDLWQVDVEDVDE